MGGPDKFLLRHNNRTLLQHCLDLAQPQVSEIVLSANGDPNRMDAYGLTIVPDLWPDHPGPLAGIISVMSWAQKARKDYAWLASFATDTPHFPQDLVARLRARAEAQQTGLVIASSMGDDHYTFALWSSRLLPELLDRFAQGERALHRIARSLGAAIEVFDGDTDFFNINTPEDWRSFSGEPNQ
jgi:molybdopterin-guanine dinucleotide biosynthesis protein A